jgi:hypothetical protein
MRFREKSAEEGEIRGGVFPTYIFLLFCYANQLALLEMLLRLRHTSIQ